MHQNAAPILYRHRPFIHNTHRHQVKLFEQGTIVNKGAFRLRHFAELPVKIFKGVNSVSKTV